MPPSIGWKQFFFGSWVRVTISIMLIVVLVATFSFFAMLLIFAIFVFKLVAASLLNFMRGGSRCRCK
jgi:type IV secretory pathway VirB6-like protein